MNAKQFQMKRVEYLIKHNRFIQSIYRIVFSLLFSIFSFFTPVKKNLVLISSFSGKKFNDSPKAIFDCMVKSGLIERYEVVWAFENPSNFELYHLKTVKIDSFKYFITAFKAKYWITNVNIERGLNFKKRNQVYLNTWHGTGPKTIGNAAPGRRDYNFKKVNYLCSDGEFLKDIFVKNFNARAESVLLCGRPREDVLYHADLAIKQVMMDKYNIKKTDFVILYAPTWREPKSKELQSSLSIDLDIKKILETIPNSKILFRAHSITSKVYSKEDFGDRFISVNDEPDIGDLFFITNVLITDYSSANLDIAILNKPFICFAPDYDEYIKERPLCFDLEKEYPFGVQKNTEEVIKILNGIIKGDKKIHELNLYKQKYGPYGGNATSICLEKLFGIKYKKDS